MQLFGLEKNATLHVRQTLHSLLRFGIAFRRLQLPNHRRRLPKLRLIIIQQIPTIPLQRHQLPFPLPLPLPQTHMSPPNLLRLNLLPMLAHAKHVLTCRPIHCREAGARDVERADDDCVWLRFVLFFWLWDVEGKCYGYGGGPGAAGQEAGADGGDGGEEGGERGVGGGDEFGFGTNVWAQAGGAWGGWEGEGGGEEEEVG